jgi:hypothetical protein
LTPRKRWGDPKEWLTANANKIRHKMPIARIPRQHTVAADDIRESGNEGKSWLNATPKLAVWIMEATMTLETTPTELVEAAGTPFANRGLGPHDGTPVV